MSGHAGDALHYHLFGAERYGHRHPFLHIEHEHPDGDEEHGRIPDLMAALKDSLRRARETDAT